jgi:anti-sigma-K factor RskA
VENHDQFIAAAAPYALGALDREEKARFEAHLATCAQCAAEVRSFAPVLTALATAQPAAAPDPDVRRRLSTRLKTGSRFELRGLAVAASIAIALVLGGYAVYLRGRVSTLENRLRQTILRADAAEARSADARTIANDAQTTLAILTAKDVARVDLAGQPAAPSAAARAFWSRSRGLVLMASNLPSLAPGRTYQLWVITKEPAPISAGVLAPDANGSVTVRFDTPPDIPAPVAMAVTLEPAGGVRAPTGDKYLVGVAH